MLMQTLGLDAEDFESYLAKCYKNIVREGGGRVHGAEAEVSQL